MADASQSVNIEHLISHLRKSDPRLYEALISMSRGLGVRIPVSCVSGVDELITGLELPLTTKGDLLTRDAQGLVRRGIENTREGYVPTIDVRSDVGWSWAAPTGATISTMTSFRLLSLGKPGLLEVGDLGVESDYVVASGKVNNILARLRGVSSSGDVIFDLLHKRWSAGSVVIVQTHVVTISVGTLSVIKYVVAPLDEAEGDWYTLNITAPGTGAYGLEVFIRR